MDAYLKADTAALEKLEADDFVITTPNGKVSTKAEEVQDVKSGVLKVSELTLSDTHVRLYGKTAVVTGEFTVKGSYKGQDISGRYRFTDVLVHKKNQWRVVSSQETAIAENK